MTPIAPRMLPQTVLRCTRVLGATTIQNGIRPLLVSVTSDYTTSASLACHQQLPLQQQQHHQRVQYRFIFDHRKKRKRKKTQNPFRILGVPDSILYKDVKKKFLQIAMTNHPDTIPGDLTDEEKEKMRDTFINARIAFEALCEDAVDGTAMHKDDIDEEDAMANFDSWFKSETGFDTPFQFDMDPETMKEVASMTETIGGGLDRDGGMWALARMVTSAVKSGGDAATMLRLEAGDVREKDRNINGMLRRRRKR